ncbi:MAG: GDSL-type esterase/lipase family protein [Gemmatimonadota bacterium]
MAELRAAWLVVGLLAVGLNWALTPVIGLAIAIPWLGVMVMLRRQDTAAAMARAWRGALATRAGRFGAATLTLAAVGTAIIVSGGAGVLLALWIIAAACVVGTVWGPSALGEQLVAWALALVATGASLLAAEGVLRLDSVATRIGTPRAVDSWWQRYDPIWERNVLGLRSPYETLRKEEGVVRVVALGDSFTWGDKIEQADSTWTAQLESELARRRPGTPVEVVNLGQKGFTTVNEAEMLRRVGWQFDPDIVVVQFYLNDILPGGPNFERGYSGWLFPRAWILPERYRSGHAGRSALIHLIESVLTARRHGDRAAQAVAWTEVYQRRGPEWTALADALTEMGSAAAERGVPIVLLLFPDFIPGMGDSQDVPFAAIHEQVTRVAADAGFTTLDLTPHFIRENPDMQQWWATPYDVHPNAAAARFAARRLADHLLESLDPALWTPSVAADSARP